MKVEMTRSKVLILSPYFPCPPHDGGRNRIYNLIKYLSLTKDIYFLSYIEKNQSKSDILRLNKYCKKVYTVTRKTRNNIKDNRLPKIALEFYTSDMVKALRKVMKYIKPEIAHIEYIFMAQYVSLMNNTLTVLTEHDMSWLDFNRSFYNVHLSKKNRFEEWCKINDFSQNVLKLFDGVITLTENEDRYLKRIVPACKSAVVSTGTDPEYYHPKAIWKIKGNNILFIAHFKHYPNLDALFYFIEEIFPKVLLSLPDVTFTVIGSGMKKNLLLLNKDKIRILGEVKDVRRYLWDSDVFVAPIRLGLGIKGKILEAMACGIPVIATKEAAEGIKCKNNKDILLAKNPDDFSDKLIDLLSDNKKRAKLSSNARSLVERNYDWEKLAEKQSEFYNMLILKRIRPF